MQLPHDFRDSLSANRGNTWAANTDARHGCVSLVTLVTAHRALLFDELLLARLVVRQLKQQHGAITLAYVVMPDHVHWLLKVAVGSTLSEVVCNAKTDSANGINSFYGRTGRVWQKGFHEHPVMKNDDLKYIARYIITNPIRAGLAKSVRDYSHWDAIWV